MLYLERYLLTMRPLSTPDFPPPFQRTLEKVGKWHVSAHTGAVESGSSEAV